MVCRRGVGRGRHRGLHRGGHAPVRPVRPGPGGLRPRPSGSRCGASSEALPTTWWRPADPSSGRRPTTTRPSGPSPTVCREETLRLTPEAVAERLGEWRDDAVAAGARLTRTRPDGMSEGPWTSSVTDVGANGWVFTTRTAGPDQAAVGHPSPRVPADVPLLFARQLPPSAGRGYRAVAPDQRGFSPGARPPSRGGLPDGPAGRRCHRPWPTPAMPRPSTWWDTTGAAWSPGTWPGHPRAGPDADLALHPASVGAAGRADRWRSRAGRTILLRRSLPPTRGPRAAPAG